MPPNDGSYAGSAKERIGIAVTLSRSGRPLPELTGIPPDRPGSEDPIGPGGARQAR